MHIAYITMQFPAPSETFAATDVKALKRQGVEVSVISMKPEHKEHKPMVIDRELSHIPVFSCNANDYIRHAFLSLMRPKLLVKLLGWLNRAKYGSFIHRIKCIALIPSAFFVLSRLEKIRPQVVHLFWGHFPAMAGYLAHIKKTGSKITMFSGAYDLEMKLEISKKMALIAQRVFTHCHYNVNELKKMGIPEEKITVIYRGVDTEKFSKAITDKSIKGNPLIVTATRLIKDKGVDKSLEVIRVLKEKYQDIRYHIAGDGPEKERLMDLCREFGLADNVLFHGHVPHHRVMELLKSAQVFLLLSKYKGERLPNVIKEAMYCRCVPVTTMTPGINELISHQTEGLVVESNTPQHIAEEIMQILGDKDRFRSMQNSGREKIEQYFDSQKLMTGYLEQWRELL